MSSVGAGARKHAMQGRHMPRANAGQGMPRMRQDCNPMPSLQGEPWLR